MAVPLILMLEILSTKSAEPKKAGVGVDGDSKTRRNGSEIDGGEFNGSEVNGDEINSGKFGDDEIGKKVLKISKSKSLFKSKKTIRSSDFLILGAKLAFTKLRQAFLTDLSPL